MSTLESSDASAPNGAYALDNAGHEALARFPALSDAFDAGTQRHLASIGVGAGWRCLEVGGGGGSVARWLAHRVGASGHVLVTDIDPRHLCFPDLPEVEVRVHDIAMDPLPAASFDLVHARLVLLHVREREAALANMIAALKPGGWLVDEEFDISVFPDPALSPGETLLKTHVALARVLDDRGVDRTFGRRLFGRLRALGLDHVGSEGRTFMWPAGSPGSAMMRANYSQLRAQMIDAGHLTQAEFDSDIAALDDPDFLMPSPVLWAAWGQKRE
ncbi:MAG TPA: methyltransferase domain-containing protein [Gemmatimonadaceae bacterium]|nr:methyltransferase domain-containing protein [Gemmatimonadaceae bacterium]